MDNKKIAIIIILATLLAFLVSTIIFKTNKSAETKDNQIEVTEPVNNLETKQEEVVNDTKEVINTPAVKVQPVKQAPKIEKPLIKNVKIEIEPIKVVEEIAPIEPYEADDNVIVIPQEYKIKSPAKYSFK